MMRADNSECFSPIARSVGIGLLSSATGIAILLLAACANPIVDATWSRYTTTGNAEHARGNLLAAEEAHRRAIINAQIGHLGAEKEAIATHNLALVKRDLCKLDGADDLFRRALELRENNRDTPPANLSGTIFELAQLRYERGRYAEAAALMERGLPLVETLGAEQRAPTTLARLLEEYADALRKLNRDAYADTIRARANALIAARGLDLKQAPPGPPFNHPPCH